MYHPLCLGEDYSKEKSKAVEKTLKEMHSKAKKLKQVNDADIESSNTPSYEQGKRLFNDMGHKFSLEKSLDIDLLTVVYIRHNENSQTKGRDF